MDFDCHKTNITYFNSNTRIQSSSFEPKNFASIWWIAPAKFFFDTWLSTRAKFDKRGWQRRNWWAVETASESFLRSKGSQSNDKPTVLQTRWIRDKHRRRWKTSDGGHTLQDQVRSLAPYLAEADSTSKSGETWSSEGHHEVLDAWNRFSGCAAQPWHDTADAYEKVLSRIFLE